MNRAPFTHPGSTTPEPSNPSHFREWIFRILFFLFLFAVFYASPVVKLGDSKYTMLLSEHLLLHGSFRLDRYLWPHVDSRSYPEVPPGEHWPRHFIRLKEHAYYVYPHGTALFTVPLTGLMRLAGWSAIDKNGQYSLEGDKKMQKFAAAFLSAIVCVLFFMTARLLLKPAPSLLLALAGGLTGPLWSTASRSLQSHTWNAVFLAAVLYAILRVETGRGKMRPVLLASLLAGGFYVRPTAWVYIIPLTIWMFFRHRKRIFPFLAAGAFWLALFVVYSWSHFGTLLPTYYRLGTAMSTEFLGKGLQSAMISPSRGLLIYFPAVLIPFLLISLTFRRLHFKALFYAGMAVLLLNLTVISTWWCWWSGGGGTYGARYWTDTVPVFVLMTILGLQAFFDDQKRKEHNPRLSILPRYAFLTAGLFLLLGSGLVINGAGALSKFAGRWNDQPVPIDQNPQRIFDWRHPQFWCAIFPTKISGRIETAGGGPVAGVRISFSQGGGQTSTDAQGFYRKAIGYGWSGKVRPLGKRYRFTPRFREYDRIAKNRSGQDFTCTPLRR
ncbi:MAG: carboxypeptidase regulatory-like domain-containing protein [Candidatus Aminicenantes bacterium]|nr:carboxypeptidase regulatory-like domain-containing protein [Candidatus Aminicenantes bacterium]